jgi:hypothetical protein
MFMASLRSFRFWPTLTNLPASTTSLSAMDVGEWFNKGDYSDLTIKLSNGSEVKVHKIIVCQQNEYFRKLCGPNSHFAVSSNPARL